MGYVVEDKYIKSFIDKHGSRYTYDKFKYEKSTKKITITCRVHGDFKLRIEQHKNGVGCPKCNKVYLSRLTGTVSERFITASNKIHGSIYDYSKVNYKTNSTPVIIICKIHGEFLQRPANHKSGSSCPACNEDSRESGRNKKDLSFYLDKIDKIHNGKYKIYPESFEYINCKEHIPVHCPEHGVFYASPDNLSRGKGCNQCGINRTTETLTKTVGQYIEQALIVHEGVYSYELCDYDSKDKIVKVTCPIHGAFDTCIKQHSYGRVCPQCVKRNCGIWSPSCLKKDPEHFKNRSCILYFIEISVPSGDKLYKIGVSNNLPKRFALMSKEGVSVDSIIHTYDTNTYDAIILENKFSKEFKCFKVKASHKFGGYTECFKYNTTVLDGSTNFFNKASS